MNRVLIIDDDPVVCRILTHAVQQLGFDAQAAHTVQEGLRLGGEQQPDLVFLDVQLPDGNGLEILPSLRALASRPEVIILTASASTDSAEIAIRNGAWDYLQKSVPVSEIALTLDRVSRYRHSLQKSRQAVKALKLDGIIGSSPQLRGCFDLLAQAAISDANVLITGETGTGKDLFARAVHENSRRAAGELVVVDCASLPPTLVESILFGHEKGAYTSADRAREGLFKRAHLGTLFLDEVGDLPLELQKTFLRVLESRRFRPLGGDREIESDFRLVAATNRNLEAACASGRFREDLFYRLRAITIELPPLRERPDDIREITLSYVSRICNRYQIPTKGLSPDFLDALCRHDWQGNVRELVHALERAIVKGFDDSILIANHLPTQIRIAAAKSALPPPDEVVEQESESGIQARSSLPTFREHREALLREEERKYLLGLMAVVRGSIKNACAVSGLGRTRLYLLLKKHGISRFGWN